VEKQKEDFKMQTKKDRKEIENLKKRL